MEVSLVDTKNVPDSCLISVRSGSTRRQAPADPGKLRLTFPKGTDLADPFKVDLLAFLGCVKFEFHPGMENYPLEVPRPDGDSMKLTLKVKEILPGSAAVADATAAVAAAAGANLPSQEKSELSNASQRHRLALQARTYLDDHRLLIWIQNLLQDLIKDRPDDPWNYIDENTMRARKMGVQDPLGEALLGTRPGQAIPSPIPSPIPSVRMDDCPPPRSTETKSDQATKSAAPSPLELPNPKPSALVEEVASKSAAPLPPELPDQKPSALVEEVDSKSAAHLPLELTDQKPSALVEDAKAMKATDEGDELCKKTRGLLLQKITDGSLEQMLKDVQDVKGEKATDEVDELRKETGGLLLQASADGHLAQALKDAQDAKGEKAIDEVDELRKETVGLLLQANTDGLLAQTLKDAKDAKDMKATDEDDEVRKETGRLLLQASASGRSEQILKDAQEAKVKQEPAPEVIGVLEVSEAQPPEADSDARLDTALKEAKGHEAEVGKDSVEVDQIRNAASRLKSCLITASSDGRLETAVKEEVNGHEAKVGTDSVDVNPLQNTASLLASCLITASSDGRLETTLNDVLGNEAKDATVEKAQLDSDLNELRKFTGGLLLEAIGDGRLESALKDATVGKVADAAPAVTALAATAEEANGDGPLAIALEEAKDDDAPLAATQDDLVESRKQIEELSEVVKQKEEVIQQLKDDVTKQPTIGTAELKQLEAKIRARNDKFRKENEALRRKNVHLKGIFSKDASKLIAGNDQFRKDLDQLIKAPSKGPSYAPFNT